MNQPKNHLISFRGQQDYYKSVSYDNLLKRPYLSPRKESDMYKMWDCEFSPKKTNRKGATLYTNRGNGNIEPLTVTNFKGRQINNTVYQKEGYFGHSNNSSPARKSSKNLKKKRRSLKAFHQVKKLKRSNSEQQMFGPVGAYEIQPSPRNVQMNTDRNFAKNVMLMKQSNPASKTLTYGSRLMRMKKSPLREASAHIKNQNSLIKIARSANYDLPEPLPMPKQIFQDTSNLKTQLFHENLQKRSIPAKIFDWNADPTRNAHQSSMQDLSEQLKAWNNNIPS